MTDIIGKPVLMLDASRKVTGAAEYDVFGFPNRVSLDKETAHPYANNSNFTLADFTQAIGGTANPSTQIRVRAIFDVVDTEGPVATPADYVFLKDPDGGVALTPNIGGAHRGQVWSPWVIPSAGRVQVPFISNASGNTYTGLVMAGYEYQRFQTGAQAFWTPMGFPGQYHDDETDLSQNWNRFYDAAIGRYLEPEPMMQTSNFHRSKLSSAKQTAVFSYAQSNPVGFTDDDGLFIPDPDCDYYPSPGDCLSAASSITDTSTDMCPSLKKCIEDGCRANQGPRLDCSKKSTGGKCGASKGGGKVGAIAEVGYCTDPGHKIIWCSDKVSPDCRAKKMVHELAHTCGWQHNGKGGLQNGSVPGADNDGELQCH